MPTLTINLTLRKDTARELTFDQVDNNFVSLKNAIVAVNNDLDNYSPESHDHGMAGMVAHFAMQNPPAGWLVADGRAVSRSTYAKLFSAIGVAFGVGNGIDTFNLPDLRGEFIRGWDNGRGVDPNRDFASKQRGSVLVNDDGNDVLGISRKTGTVFKHDTQDPYDGQGLQSHTRASSVNTNYYTSPAYFGHSRPRNIALLACIKF